MIVYKIYPAIGVARVGDGDRPSPRWRVVDPRGTARGLLMAGPGACPAGPT